MLNIDTLNNVIAVVVVILTLSLIVQSIQAILKKLIAIKSQQLEDSLVDLFEHVLAKTNVRTGRLRNTPVLRRFFLQGRLRDKASLTTQTVFDAVMEQFRGLGRVTQAGSFMLDSLSKDDLLKVLARVAPNAVIPAFTTKVQRVCTQIQAVETQLNAINPATLPPSASPTFGRLHDALAPLLHDYRTISAAGVLNPNVVLGDLYSFGQQASTLPFSILGELQERLAAAQRAGQPDPVITAAITNVQSLTALLTTLRTNIDVELAPLRKLLADIGTWFDTVMQGFDERYQRGMKTWSVVISAVVVICLNANIFDIYNAIAGSDLLRNNLATVGQQLLDKHDDIACKEAALTGKTNDPQCDKKNASESNPATDTGATGKTESLPKSPTSTDTSATSTATGTTLAATTTVATTDDQKAPIDTGVTTMNSGPAPAKPKPPDDKLLADIEHDRKQINELVQLYAGFGFEPLSWEGVKDWWHGLWIDVDPNDKSTWRARRADDLHTLLGWIIMTLLLSLGAPFWHDTLESLFGVKNLLRKKTDTQNIEERSGAGNPKS
jgi:hypothetical protein